MLGVSNCHPILPNPSLIFYPEELKNDTITTEILEGSQTGHVLFCRVNAVSPKIGPLKR